MRQLCGQQSITRQRSPLGDRCHELVQRFPAEDVVLVFGKLVEVSHVTRIP